MSIPASFTNVSGDRSGRNSTEDSDGEFSQCEPNGARHDGNSTTIEDALKIHSADATLHPPTGFLGNVHSQHLATLPIHLATVHRKVQSLESLLRSGADQEIRAQHGCTTLHLLITHWPKINGSSLKPSTKFERNMAALQQRAEDCLRLLCGSGVNVNARVEAGSGDTALHLAVRYGALPAVGILAGHGADVNASDRSGMLPLHMAAGTLDPAMTAALIRCGADVNKAAHQSGATALHFAVTAAAVKNGAPLPADLSCISELLTGGALPDAQNKAGRTPLHEACQGGQEEVVDLLLEHGADVNIRTASGENGLFVFLDRRANLRSAPSLPGKLLSLTHPLTITNSQGALPSSLLLSEYHSQRDTLLRLSKQPLDLQSICRIHIRRQQRPSFRQSLKEMLPEKLSNFVYSYGNRSSTIALSGTCHKMHSEMPQDFTRTFGDVNTVE
ncbi:ankyrin repeat domain-containing protein 61-like [Megalops cyprinoides]|uniref:ankyrin repeat domain-containing protein 61-like n=1 Tax=Megalops cyprinoides TaxID=118141 RepID=UPI0018642A70|nr:ankyrin repeat domain-containing protein 61-like [Megalops cyprinoides]